MDLFREINDGFIIYVIEQRFAVGRGYEYFRQYKGKENYIQNDAAIKNRIRKILQWSQRNVPNVSELVSKCFSFYTSKSIVSIAEAISAFCKLFTVNSHQAVGPEVLDPIIIQEGEVTEKNLAQLIELHKESILQPVIIILLKDNDFDRAKQLLVHCPNGINAKFIRNSGETIMYRVINTGADNVASFIESYARQCYSTCSKTQRSILLNNTWNDNSYVHKYAPQLMKIRSSLLCEEKKAVRLDVNTIISDIQDELFSLGNNRILQMFECIARLSRVYCFDKAGEDMKIAYSLAKDCQNDLLLAHVYRYSHFLYKSRDEQIAKLWEAEEIFNAYEVEDHALYCRNNRLIHQFYSDNINMKEFRQLQQTAINNTPGLVGMCYIYNNLGVAYLYSGDPEQAIEYFHKGLDYARERIVQRLGLSVNILIAKTYMYEKTSEEELQKIMNYIFDSLESKEIPFISANYAVNLISIAVNQDISLARFLTEKYPVADLVCKAFSGNIMGSGSLKLQLARLNSLYDNILPVSYPQSVSSISGFRERFIERNGLNPAIFNAWL